MPVKVERLPNEPIIIVTLSGDLSSDVVQEMSAETAELMEGIEGRVYRITDIRLTEISFPDLVRVLDKSANGQPGSRICGVLLGTHGWSRFFADSLHQERYGQLHIPIFDDFDDAMSCLREQIVLDRAG